MKEYSYNDFYDLTQKLVNLKTSTGDDVTPDKISATKLNLVRMKRIYTNTIVCEKLAQHLATNIRFII